MTDHLAERPGPHVSVTWYGQAGFRLAAGDSRVLIDPFLTDRADRRYPPPAVAADFPDITLVLCTHEHVDHMDLPFLRKFCAVNPSARIVLPAPVIEVAVSGGLDAERLAGAVPGEAVTYRGRRCPRCRAGAVTSRSCTSSRRTAARSGSSATRCRSAASGFSTPGTAWSTPSFPPPCPPWLPTC